MTPNYSNTRQDLCDCFIILQLLQWRETEVTHTRYFSCTSTSPSPLGCEQRCSFQCSCTFSSPEPVHTSDRRKTNTQIKTRRIAKVFTPIRLFHILSRKNQKAICVFVAFYAIDQHKIGLNCKQKEVFFFFPPT